MYMYNAQLIPTHLFGSIPKSFLHLLHKSGHHKRMDNCYGAKKTASSVRVGVFGKAGYLSALVCVWGVCTCVRGVHVCVGYVHVCMCGMT